MAPLFLALAAFVVVIAGVLWLKLPPFLALIFGALLVAIGTSTARLRDVAIRDHGVLLTRTEDGVLKLANGHLPGGPTRVYRGTILLQEVGRGDVVANTASTPLAIAGVDLQAGDVLLHESNLAAVEAAASTSPGERVAFGFGDTCRKIGILIAMAAVIGCCLLESGAAHRIVDVTRRVFGEARTPIAFSVSGFVVGIPVFFDTVFYLLMPLARAMRLKTGANYLLYVMSIVVGASMAHSLVPPTPGPLLVAAKIDGVEVVDMMLGGIIVGFFAVSAGYLFAVWANRRWEIPLRDTGSESAEPELADEPNPPSFFVSLLPIALPVVLLSAKTIAEGMGLGSVGWAGSLMAAIQFLGDKNIALILAAIIALAILIRQRRRVRDTSWTNSVQAALTSGGMILLITCAGGALGHVLRESGVAEAIQHQFPSTRNGFAILVLAFVVTALVRFVQGSATVAMITSVSIVGPLASQITLGFHPVYLALAIGCGSKPLPWMNDSGFWIVGKMSGMTEAETLRTFSITLTIMGVVGFVVTLAGAMLFPLAPQ